MAINSANTTNMTANTVSVNTGAASPTGSDAAVTGAAVAGTDAATTAATTEANTSTTTDALASTNQAISDGTGMAGLDSAQNIVNDPNSFLTPEMKLENSVPTIDQGAGNLDPNAEKYQMDTGGLNVGVTTPDAVTYDPNAIPTNQGAETYDAVTTGEAVEGALGEAATGEVSDEAIVEAEQIDMKGTATGYNADGTVNYTGQALTQFATQNISTMIDTSTVAGKLLAQELGEGNYTDTKATVMGQLDIISQQFEGPNGEPKIPAWAQATARNVSRIAAFKGMTGTAATAAMSTALMEATLPIAQQEAAFFQTVTLKNLDNKQQMTINRANVLAKMDQLNLDARMQAAITNSKNFMDMDLANLANEQQMAVVNTQARVQSILEDAKSENASRMFAAESANDFQKFYDNLGAQINMHNINQINEMNKFSAGEINSAAKFNADLENNREQFYREMQYNIDVSNAKWRQTVTLAEAEMAFEAASQDVQNMFNLSVEAQNQLWDRVDALLDYNWKSNETALDRETRLEEARLAGSAAKSAGRSSMLGSIAGAIGGALIMSDMRLKDNITSIGATSQGIPLYTWEWNEIALNSDLPLGPTVGVLAQELQQILPDAVHEHDSGYLMVDYSKVSLQ